jgi:hypothetical protein
MAAAMTSESSGSLVVSIPTSYQLLAEKTRGVCRLCIGVPKLPRISIRREV